MENNYQINDNKHYYTFFYCNLHDDGAIIRGNHQYADDKIKICTGGKCDSVDYNCKGVIKYDGNDINWENFKLTRYPNWNMDSSNEVEV